MNSRSREAINTWVEAQWFCRDAVAAGSICEHYAHGEGWLPCGVPLGALKSFPWRQHFCFMNSDLLGGREVTLFAAREAFLVLALTGLSR